MVCWTDQHHLRPLQPLCVEVILLPANTRHPTQVANLSANATVLRVSRFGSLYRLQPKLCLRVRASLVPAAVPVASCRGSASRFGLQRALPPKLWLCASWSVGTSRGRHARIDGPVRMSGGACYCGASAPLVLVLSPQQARPTPRPVAARETHREASLLKVLCSSELLTSSCSCRLTATLRSLLQRTSSLPWIHVVTRIATPCRFQLRLSSRDPQDFAKRVRQTWSNSAAWLGCSG